MARKGFKQIVVAGIAYSYAVSFPKNQKGRLIVYRNSTRFDIPVDFVAIPERENIAPTWRGKHGSRSIGSYEAAYLISAYQTSARNGEILNQKALD